MKDRVTHLGLTFLLTAFVFGFVDAVPTAPMPGTETEMTVPAGPLKGMSMEDVLTTDYKQLKAEKGVELNVMQRFTLKRIQKRYAKLQKNPKKAEKFKERMSRRATSPNPNKLGLIAMILGIAGIILIWFPIVGIIGFFALVAAFTLGLIGLKRDEKPGMAIAGVVLGSIGLALLLIAVIAVGSLYV